MRIFILEDSDERIKFFKKQLLGENLFIAKTVEKGKIELSKHEHWDMIFLDHDLDGAIFIDSNKPNTGYQLAKYIKKNNTYSNIILHTMNPNGSKNMKAILKNAKIIPFSILLEGINENIYSRR